MQHKSGSRSGKSFAAARHATLGTVVLQVYRDPPLMESPANPNFSTAIATISVAQICHSTRYTSAQPSALRALSDVAGRYVLSLGSLSAASAASHNRTDCNLLDLVLSLETLCSTRGFSGASDPTRPLPQSAVLKELMAFVRIADEVPFAKPILRERRNRFSSSSFSSSKSFAQVGREVPMPHVPGWLPCFPDSWEGWRREEEGGEDREVGKVANGSSEREMEREFDCNFGLGLNLPETRERVRFGIGSGSIARKGKRRRIGDSAVD